MSSLSFARKFPSNFKSGSGILCATLLSGEDDVWSRFNNKGAEKGSFFNNGVEQTAIQQKPDEIAFGTPAAVITPNRSGFLSDVDEFDLDHAVEGFASIPEAIEGIRQGKVCLLYCFHFAHFLKYCP